MLAVALIISILSGAVAAGTLLMIGLPVWASVLAYPIVGTLGLLAAAAFLSADSTRLRRVGEFGSNSGSPLRQPQQH